jgi:hypothetical protein
MQVNPNSSNRGYLLKLAERKAEFSWEELNSLNWKTVKETLSSTHPDVYERLSSNYVNYSDANLILQDKADKLAEAEKAEAEKQAGMNVVHRTFYKTIQKPVGDWWNKHFKKEPKSLEMPKQHLPFIWYD